MKNSDCTVLVCSCDKYADVEKPFISLWRKFWPDCPFETTLLSETLSSDGFDRAILTGRGKTWCEMLAEALEKIESPYVLMLMNDYFLNAPVDTATFLRRLDEARRFDAASLRLNPLPPGRSAWSGSDLLEMPKDVAYCVTCQASIWNRDFLLGLARRNKSAWEFERYGSFMVGGEKRPLLVTPTKEFPFVDAVHKGHWEKFGLAVCHENGIDLTGITRTLPPFKVRVVEGIKALIFRIVPTTLLVRFQNRFALGAKETTPAGGIVGTSHYITQLTDLVVKFKVWGMPGVASYFRRKINDRLHKHKLFKLHLASKCKTPSRGITVIGDLTDQASLSKTLRDFVLCLKDACIPFQTYDTTWKPMIPPSDIANLITPKDNFDLHRYSHIVIMFRSPLTTEMTKGHIVGRIAFHDSEHGIHTTATYLRESGDDIIAMSDFNHNYFKRAFPNQNVWKITYPFRFKLGKATPREELRHKYGIEDTDFVVFFNFDFGSYYRKNVLATMKAFALAFKGDSTAKLLFKTKGANNNKKQFSEMMAYANELSIDEQFIHISKYLPRADIDGLTAACDVYISLHKSEGFGLGMAEAMSQGKPVLATHWSANTEFCHDDTAWCIPYKMVPILPHEYPPAMVEWAEADVETAARMLREIRTDPTTARGRADYGKMFMAKHFSLSNIKHDINAFLDGGLR